MDKTNIFKYFHVFVALVFVMTVVLCVFQITKYHEARVLCDKIAAGEEIDTNFSNGATSPKWHAKLFAFIDSELPRIPLVEACYYKNIQAVKVLLENGADPNEFFQDSFSPLEAAIVGGVDEKSIEIIRLLFEHGADVNKYGSSAYAPVTMVSAWIYAEDTNPLLDELLFIFLENGLDCNISGYNFTFFASVKSCKIDVVNYMISHNMCDINERGQDGQTAMMLLSKSKDESSALEMAKLLIGNGADKSIRDNNGKTAYDYALEVKYADLANILKP